MITQEQYLELLALADCEHCPLNTAPGPVPGAGSIGGDFALVAEAPGRDEAEHGIPMVGRSGNLLNVILDRAGMDRDDIYITNSVWCRPTDRNDKDAPPPKEALAACRPRLDAELRLAQPEALLATGRSAIRTLVGSERKVGELAGTMQWSEEWGLPVHFTFHPAYALRGGGDSALAQIRSTIERLKRPDDEDWIDADAIRYRRCRSSQSQRRAVNKIKAKGGLWSLDTETAYSGDPTYRLLTIQVSDGEDTYVFENGFNKKAIREMLGDPGLRWVIHNMSFDYKYLLYHFGLTPDLDRVDDSMALAMCITEKQQDLSLKVMSRKWFQAPYYDEAVDKLGTLHAGNTMEKLDPADLAKYGALDAYYTRRLPEVLDVEVAREGNRSLYEGILKPLQATFAEMEMSGIKINQEKLADLEATVAPLVKEREEAIVAYAAGNGWKEGDLNPRSHPQVNRFLYDVMGFDPRVVGGRLTGKEFYELSPYADTEFAELLREYRGIDKLYGTNIKGMWKWIWPDGRIHPSFLANGTVTGRTSSRNPNVQNIPNPKSLSGETISIRGLFDAPPGMVFFEADYKALELWMAYHYSKDPALYDALTSSDFHTRVASFVFGIPEEMVIKDQRIHAKRVTYGVMYGITGQGLTALIPGIDMHAGNRYIKRWFRAFADYYGVWKSWKKAVLEAGELVTPTGRTRRWELLATQAEIQEAERQAVNMPNQSLAGDTCLMSLIELVPAFKRESLGEVVLTVHDSIEGYIWEDKIERAVEVITEVMEKPRYETHLDRLPIDIQMGTDWSVMVEPEKLLDPAE